MFNSYVAIGDSFTEGVGDTNLHYPNQVRGWADRIAEQFAQQNPIFTYANLAIRGRKIQQIIDEQLQPAIDMNAELISFTGGGNDLIRPKVDVDEVISQVAEVLKILTNETTSKIMVFTYSDLPAGWYSSMLRGRYALYNEFLRDIADKYPLILIDWWKMYPHYRLDAYWAQDKIHMSTIGHAYLAEQILITLGYAPEKVPNKVETEKISKDPRDFSGTFIKGTALPWISRRLRGVSSGDLLSPKYAQLTKISPPSKV